MKKLILLSLLLSSTLSLNAVLAGPPDSGGCTVGEPLCLDAQGDGGESGGSPDYPIDMGELVPPTYFNPNPLLLRSANIETTNDIDSFSFESYIDGCVIVESSLGSVGNLDPKGEWLSNLGIVSLVSENSNPTNNNFLLKSISVSIGETYTFNVKAESGTGTYSVEVYEAPCFESRVYGGEIDLSLSNVLTHPAIGVYLWERSNMIVCRSKQACLDVISDFEEEDSPGFLQSYIEGIGLNIAWEIVTQDDPLSPFKLESIVSGYITYQFTQAYNQVTRIDFIQDIRDDLNNKNYDNYVFQVYVLETTIGGGLVYDFEIAEWDGKDTSLAYFETEMQNYLEYYDGDYLGYYQND